MKILLINHYAGSPKHGMEYRPFYFAQEWIKMGHQVIVVAASQSHVRSLQLSETSDYTEEEIEGIHYVWLKTPRYQGNGIKRVINICTFLWKLCKYKKKWVKSFCPDVVVSSSTYTLDIFPAYLIAKSSKAKLVYEVHDLWPLSPIELGGMSKWHPFMLWVQCAENFAYKKSDKIISMLPKTLSHMESHGMNPQKFSHIPNGVRSEDWTNDEKYLSEEHCLKLKQLKLEYAFLVIYAGAHGIANGLENFIEAASLLKGEKVTFVLMGQGPEKIKLQEKAQKLNLANVVFLPSASRGALPTIFSLADVLFISLQRKRIFRFGISPNKLMDYMMAAKPVINAIEAGNDMVLESGCGLTITPENSQAIAKAVLDLKKLTLNERLEMGENGRKYVLEHHDYKVLANRFIEALI